MKAKQIFKAALAAAVLTFVGAQTVSAKSWRVNNNSTKKANFVDINAAMASADVVAGDTLYLDPGCVMASSQTISKAVTVIGTGYFLQNGLVAATINNSVSIIPAFSLIPARRTISGVTSEKLFCSIMMNASFRYHFSFHC